MTTRHSSRPAPHWMMAFLVLTLPLAGASARAGVLVDTFDAGGGFSPTASDLAAYGERTPVLPSAPHAARVAVLTVIRSAAQFSVPPGDYTLDSITLPLAVSASAPAALLRVRLTTDNGGVPGTTLEVLSENQDIWPTLVIPFSTATTLPSATHPALAGGSAYWIVTELTSVPNGPNSYIDYEWFLNTHGVQVPVIQQTSMFSLPTDPWPTATLSEPLAFRVEGSSTADVGAQASGSQLLALGTPWPNPSRTAFHVDFRLGEPATVTGEVFDVAGHRVRSLVESQPFAVGEHRLDWDGDNASGQRVAAGVYMVRVSTGAISETRRIARIP